MHPHALTNIHTHTYKHKDTHTYVQMHTKSAHKNTYTNIKTLISGFMAN